MFTSEAEKAMEASLKQRGRVNIVIAGRIGVGKSTLINSIFQGRMADTGQGRPGTKETR
jgi:predicted GTPase